MISTRIGRTLLPAVFTAGALALGCGGGAGGAGDAPTQVAAPTFSPVGGTFNAATSVSLSSATPGASIRYTTDGSDPSATAGNLFAAPFALDATTTVRAIAYKDGMADSPVVQQTFTIETALQRVAAPTFSPDGGSFAAAASVALATLTPGASIRYTTDGSDPSATVGNVFAAPFALDATTTVRAIAYKDGMADSPVVQQTFTIETALQRVAAPTFSPDGGSFDAAPSVSLATPTLGATIRYTIDGTTPSRSLGAIYSTPFTVGATATVRAIAYKDGMADSPVAESTFTIGAGQAQVAAPRFSPDGGVMTTPFALSLTSDTSGATIRYTTDGTTIPSDSVGTFYTAPFPVTQATRVRAIAYKPGMTTSSVTEALFTFQNAAPTFDPPAGTYAQPVIVALSSTSAFDFQYTTDGTTPTVSTGTYYDFQQFLPIATTTTLRAIAYSSGTVVEPSDVTTAEYIINKAAPPIFSMGGGTEDKPTSVILSTATPDATIRYTKDGTTPTTSSGIVYDGSPVPLSASVVRFRAITFKSGMDPSDVVEVVLSSGARVPPVFTAGAVSTRTIQLESAADVALMLHNGGADTGDLGVQGYLVQGSAKSPAGGASLACRPVRRAYETFMRAGTDCPWSFSVVAQSKAGTKAGAAIARFELRDATAKTLAAYEVPVTIVP